MGWLVAAGLILAETGTARADVQVDLAAAADGATDFPRAFPAVAALCADYLADVATRRADLEANAREAGVPLAAATCHVSTRPLGVRFAASTMYRRAFFLEQSDGLETDLRLVVELLRGLVPTAISWATIDPLDPGCPGIPETLGIAALRVENGYLVAVLRQTIITYDADGKPHTKPILGATWCGDADGTLRCRTYESQYDAPLGRFSITASGELVRQD